MAEKPKKKASARLRARVKWMTPEEKQNLLRGLAGLLYEDEPGTLDEKTERLIGKLLGPNRVK